MNERDIEIREKAWALVSDEERERNELYETRERWERCDQKFADLIRADERSNIRPQSSMAYQEGMEAANRAATASWTLMCKKMVELEREACAIMADECVNIEELGAAIRARGNT